MKSMSFCLRHRFERGARAHLETGAGVRPSPGAAEPRLPGALEYFDPSLFAGVAAPEDGRTPAWRRRVVVLSRCARGAANAKGLLAMAASLSLGLAGCGHKGAAKVPPPPATNQPLPASDPAASH